MKRLLNLIVLLVTVQSGFAQMPDSVRSYVDTALKIIQTRSLFANEVDWGKTRDTAYILAAGATSYKEAFPAISYAYKQVKDYHGMVANSDTMYRYPAPVNFDSVLSKGIKAEFLKGNRIVIQTLDNGIAYLRVPSMNVFSRTDMDARANMLRDSLCKIVSTDPKGLIIDLRMNTGGNSAPMLSGISPIFTDSILGYGVDRDNKFLSPTRLRNGVLVDDQGQPMVTLNNTCTINSKIKLAVLIGPSTVSSGEILAAFIRQQKNTRLFGEPTAGFCNATEGFLFNNNQGYLLLTVNRIADAKKYVYQSLRVEPDITIPSRNDNFQQLNSDPTVNAARKWIQSK